MLGGLSEILSVLALVGFSAVTLWLLARPVARMGVLMPTPRMLTLAAAATALWCAALALFAPGSSQALVAQALRDLAMLGWLSATFWSAAAPMSRPLRLILRLLMTIASLALVLGAAAHWRAGAEAEPWMAPTLIFAAMIVAIGGLLIVDSGVRHASAGLRMPVMAVAGGFSLLWACELHAQLVGALNGKRAANLIEMLPAGVVLILPTYVVAAMGIRRGRIPLLRAAGTRPPFLVVRAAVSLVIAADRARPTRGGGG